MIIEQTIRYMSENYPESTGDILIEDAVFGPYLCAVKLSNGAIGIASVVEDTKIHCDKKFRDFSDFTPLRISGKSVKELFETTKLSVTVEMLRIAVINALSSKLIDSGKYKVIENSDPFDLLEIKATSRVILVGAFHSYIKKCSEIGCDFGVLELNPEALSEQHKSYYIPAEEYARVIPKAEFLIITGLTIVNNTLDELLKSVKGNTKVVVTGPSSSVIPDVLFSKYVSIIGGTKITKPELVFPLVGQGGAGYHLFQYCAVKVSILNIK